MTQTFDAFDYLEYARRRWRVLAAAAAAAVILAVCGSLLLPRQYTAVCQVLVEPPAGTDVRSAMAISPIYLESLRTYEHYASGDSLFLAALEHFGMREQFRRKSAILRVNIARSTKILEIRVTLPDARRAHDLAFYIANRTVDLSRSIVEEGNREVARAALEGVAAARRDADRVEAEWSRLIAAEPIEGLQGEIESQRALKGRTERELLDTEADIVEYTARGTHAANLADARTRAGALREQITRLAAAIARDEGTLAQRVSRRDRLEAERKTAQASYAAADARLRETRTELAYRGERLHVIDPGTVPERPSSPNLPLNVVAALAFAVMSSLIYVTLAFWHAQARPVPRRGALRVAGVRDD